MHHSCTEKRMMIILRSLCLIFSLSYSIFAFSSPADHLCRPDQRDALWELQSELHFSGMSIDLKRWSSNTDCCSWDGISCDLKTGKVTGLDLYGSSLNGTLKSNSSLFRLKHLQNLYLGSYNLSGILPDSIGNLKYLRILSLSGCKFSGKITSALGNLSYLTNLYLSGNYFTGELPDSMGYLNQLTELQLANTNLSGNFPLMLLNLTKLTQINLESNQFKGMLPSNMSILSKLDSFDISGNKFSGCIPSSLFMMPSLTKLRMRSNNFSGPLEIGNISSPSKITNLYLGGNNFNGPIPKSISTLVGLKLLDLSFWNTRRGKVDFSIFLHLKSLTFLDLSYMNTRSMVDLSLFSRLMLIRDLILTGISLKISPTLRLPSSIELLVLSSCNIVEFPKFIQNKTNLYFLDISANQIEGQVPEWLWRLPALRYANLSHNLFSGFEGSADVIQRSSTQMLDISSNAFQEPFPLLPTSMMHFTCSNNRFSGEIPRSLCDLVYLSTLVLSSNNFSGSVPVVLRISTILFRSCIFRSLINCTLLEFLNMEDNKINDTFPFWLSMLPNLQILVLRSNEFHGPISSLRDSLSFPKLRIFDISENYFTGVLPSDYFVGWSAMSSVIDIVDGLPSRFAGRNSQYYQKTVGMMNKGFKMELVGIVFTMYKTIDVSGNRLQGDVPESIGFLKELIVLNMSNNALTGSIPPSLGNLTNLQSLDLSQNCFSGVIPPELGKLTFLARMNFSYNRLEGPIPQGTQIQSQNSSSFTENPGLCGPPLQETCGRREEEEATKQEKDEEKEEKDQVLNWIAAAIGYVPGFMCGLTVGLVLTSYKRDWFMKIFHSLLNPSITSY
ncbi:hypothetical protein N665_0304s0024 [Sinapis alba]|nr:hypothetical protein N665_0304s0024 [Sinapis alba]